MENNDVLTDSVKKLYKSVSEGLGTMMVPKSLRPVIDSKAKLISNAEEVDIGWLLTEENQTGISIEETMELCKRAGSRLLYQEVKKQKNIEDVIAGAANILEETPTVSKDPVDSDWMTRFFNSVQDVSNLEMQKLWSKLLAGEVRRPSSYSLRTLDILSKLSSEEAKLFAEICKYIVEYRGTAALLNNDEINKKYNQNYEKILRLDECGLIDSSAIMSVTLKVAPGIPFEAIYGEYLIRGESSSEQSINLPIYKLTTPGRELYNIVSYELDVDYLHEVEKTICNQNSGISFSEHPIVSKNNDGTVQYVRQGRVLNDYNTNHENSIVSQE